MLELQYHMAGLLRLRIQLPQQVLDPRSDLPLCGILGPPKSQSRLLFCHLMVAECASVSVLTSQDRREKEAPQLEKNEKLRNKFEIVKILIGYFLESINFNHQNQNKIGHIRSFLRKISPLKYGMIPHIWTYMNHIKPRFSASAVGCRE